jgi:4Fe-4S ferredoxin
MNQERAAAKNASSRCPGGEWTPIVDRARCEGKGDCVRVCPCNVFEVRRMEETEYRALPAFARFRVFVHGRKTAYTPDADACRACELCVVSCPEQAIRLVPRPEVA